jgi:hypothetical protein
MMVYNFEEPEGRCWPVSSSLVFAWKFLTSCLMARSSITSSLPPGILAPGISRNTPFASVSIIPWRSLGEEMGRITYL